MNRLSPRQRYELAHREILRCLPTPPDKIRWGGLLEKLRSDDLTFSEPTVSKHLKTLKDEGLITTTMGFVDGVGEVKYYQKIGEASEKMLLVDLKDQIDKALLIDMQHQIEGVDVESILDKPTVEQEPFATAVRDCLKTLLKITYSVFGGENPPEGKVYAFALWQNQVRCKLVDAPKEDLEEEEGPVRFESKLAGDSWGLRELNEWLRKSQ